MKKVLLIMMICLALAGCGTQTEEPAETTTAPTEAWIQQELGSFEAEDGVCSGNTYISGGLVTGFTADGDMAVTTVTVAETGFYDLEFVLKSGGGPKLNYVIVDGQRCGEVHSDGAKFARSRVRRVYMTAGEHQVGLEKNWGYVDWDKVIVYTSEPLNTSAYQVSAKLSNPNATDNAKRLFSYMCDSYGKVILSGQYCDTGMMGWENRIIAQENGGKFPAVLGLDMGYYSQTGKDHEADIHTTEQAIAYWEKGGIVTLCWHWLAPEKYIDGTWYSAFRPEHTNINLTKIMDGKDPEGLELLNKDIANIAHELQLMQEAGVPVLWRPLHEASGGWFWWGAEGAETYKKLYIHLYDTLTNVYGLNNLIWIWNAQEAEWYPGDEYVDIVGMDIYAGEHVYTSQIELFLVNMDVTDGKKLVVLSENGTLFDPELAVRDGAMWGFFCTWSGDFVLKPGPKKAYSEQYTDKDMLTKVYNSEYVITRDELPDLHTYPIREDA